ncbi:hypothetical protein RAZWK3B_16790 [Roseobacter sp. AzwK-3b]|uniref:hypothetical protein n=1 Tax=Roseobacter sp. AzwK-3b TaxID=351016 RepID=UPI00015699C0|nr:hypothetical protein [Roseobacter sp. AzwK-3b]EDM71073.1 hypothetical protein RAZWK3B_16790 [Roseobacter sp. AzwK-3b]
MSLRTDMDDLERAISYGKGKEFLRGEWRLPPEPAPRDPSARGGLGNYEFIKARGD